MDVCGTSSPPVMPEASSADDVSPPSAADIRSRLQQGYALDQLWRETVGLAGDTKEPALRTVVEVLDASGTQYAVIGGVAMQLHSREPRTTLDIDLAVRHVGDIPRDALLKAGFEHEGPFPRRDNWRAPGTGARAQRKAIQFSAEDVGVEDAVTRAPGCRRRRLSAPAGKSGRSVGSEAGGGRGASASADQASAGSGRHPRAQRALPSGCRPGCGP